MFCTVRLYSSWRVGAKNRIPCYANLQRKTRDPLICCRKSLSSGSTRSTQDCFLGKKADPFARFWRPSSTWTSPWPDPIFTVPETEGLVIRQARHSDLNDILKIGQNTPGNDYLSEQFHWFLEDPHFYTIVALVNGKAVCFRMLHLVDGGQTALMRGARTHKDFRNRGIYKKLDAVLSSLIDSSPGIRYRSTAFANDHPGILQIYHKKGYQEILRKRVLSYECTGFDLKDIGLPAADKAYVANFDKHSVEQLFENTMLLDQLFPKRRLFNDYIPLRCMKENSLNVVNDFCKMFVTSSARIPSSKSMKANSGLFETLSTSGIPSNEFLEHTDLVTCSTEYFWDETLAYTIDIYPKTDLQQLDLHIPVHLKAISESTSGSVNLFVNFYDESDKDIISSKMAEYGITELMPGTADEMILVEKTLNH